MIHGRDTFSTQKAICAVLPLICRTDLFDVYWGAGGGTAKQNE